MTDHNSEEKQNPEDRIAAVFTEVVEHVENSSIEDLETLCDSRLSDENAAAMIRRLARRAAVQYIMGGQTPPPHVRAAAGMSHVDDHPGKRKVHVSLPGCKSRQWRKTAQITLTQRTCGNVRIAIRKDIAISRPVSAT